jgi:peptide/nickel transport system permease protein
MNARRTLRTVCRVILLIIFALGLLAGSVTHYSYAFQFRELPNAPPSALHLLGTDQLGRDVFTRVLYGTRISLLLAPAAALLTTCIAAILGGIAGLRGGWLEKIILATADLSMSLPLLFVLIALRAFLPLDVSPVLSVVATFIVLGLLGWPSSLRVVWAAARTLRQSDQILLARALGYRNSQLLFRQAIPSLRPVFLAQFWISIPIFILTEATLSMLGLGVMEPLPSWGNLLRGFEDFSAVAANPWRIAPLVILVLTVICFQFIFPQSEEFAR